jgi:uncharacterized protein YcfJ
MGPLLSSGWSAPDDAACGAGCAGAGAVVACGAGCVWAGAAGAVAGCCAGNNIQGKKAASDVHVKAHNQRRRTSAGKEVFLIMTSSFYQSDFRAR